MQQFTRCTNCRQWYIHSFTTIVEICHTSALRRTTVWCRRCIAEAEQRSRLVPIAAGDDSLPDVAVDSPSQLVLTAHATPGDFQQLAQEHMQLMERALHEEDTVLVPLIEDFMQRCGLCQAQLENPEQAQRLTGHQQYWAAFLRALHQSL